MVKFSSWEEDSGPACRCRCSLRSISKNCAIVPSCAGGHRAGGADPRGHVDPCVLRALSLLWHPQAGRGVPRSPHSTGEPERGGGAAARHRCRPLHAAGPGAQCARPLCAPIHEGALTRTRGEYVQEPGLVGCHAPCSSSCALHRTRYSLSGWLCLLAHGRALGKQCPVSPVFAGLRSSLASPPVPLALPIGSDVRQLG